ncbi:MAG: thioredoxin-dependent thiol peroxidase [Sphingobium sp.]|uniref:thioredoxin-dependent thiol peroxidase n=1 Tax=Sphingobium sp. TaxID=1912891 RepID=UPI0029A65859|nr:thioredoxin-dependent thiol peroxidase [Sphingobium sp.]MDX3911467.1 thioredoxin-dependent thiol peroxidase [Sphingobium sp.]
MLNVGDTVPDIALVDGEGESFTLADYAGKPVVLYFYPKADTPGCTSEAQDFTSMAEAFAQADAAVIGVSRDKPAKLKKFADKYGLKVRLGSDEPGTFCEAFGTWVEKSMYGRQYMGVERSTFLVNPEGVIARVWPKVKVKGHADEVFEALKSL